MNEPLIPDPPLAGIPARRDVRWRWIGRFVRVARRHFSEPHPQHPERENILAQQAEQRTMGVGEVLDVGKSGWFYIRWSDGKEFEFHKSDLEIWISREFAESYGPRLFPRDYGGGDLRV